MLQLGDMEKHWLSRILSENLDSVNLGQEISFLISTWDMNIMGSYPQLKISYVLKQIIFFFKLTLYTQEFTKMLTSPCSSLVSAWFLHQIYVAKPGYAKIY